MILLSLFKKKPPPEPAQPSPPSWDVPLDQTTAWITYIDGMPYV